MNQTTHFCFGRVKIVLLAESYNAVYHSPSIDAEYSVIVKEI